MKTIAIVLIMAVLSGCTTSTEFGSCVGLFDDKKPELHYKISAWNLVIGVVFFELVAPPILVVVDETFCPVGKK